MAKLLALDDCSVSLRNALLGCLRLQDEAVLLPQSARSIESNTFSNVVFKLDAVEADVPSEVFSPNWYTGLSAVRLKPGEADRLLGDREARREALRKLAAAIPSEAADPGVVVGPSLDADEFDRDQQEWTAGFDGPGACVGLYVAEHSCAPDSTRAGMNRVHREVFLVAKAGGGVAASTFHSRLCEGLKKGASLESVLERGTEPGPKALRRVSQAGARNRGRILLLAAEALGLHMVDTIGDSASQGKYRTAVTTFDVNANTLRRVDTDRRPMWQYTAAVDAQSSQGLATCSNVADGFVFFFSSSGEVAINLRNDAHSTIPFASPRIRTSREFITEVTNEHKRALQSTEVAHADTDWLSERFCWKPKAFKAPARTNPEPLALWGSHAHEQFVSKFSRELGLSTAQVVRLRPELVCLPALEAGRLRAVLRHVEGHLRATGDPEPLH